MYFVDSTGHPFYQQSFNYQPIGYEYYQNKYTFWIDNKDHSYCSINNYYIRPIYILLNEKAESMSITIDSKIFGLISSVKFEEQFIINKRELNIDEEDIVNALQLNDILELEVQSTDEINENGTKYMYPFYVIGNCPEAGTFFTNVLINANYEDSTEEWCSITVGGEFNEENEILYINGRNMGIDLPHEIIRAVYNASYINDVFDEDLYNEKLKEYLIEYMSIRGEIGNYKSAINSLKWFGWGDKVELVSLLKTDNQFMTQFIRDYFDTESDIIESFKHFINTTLISLIVWENKETGEYHPYDLDADFMGENQPVLESLFDKMIPVLYGGVGEETYYYRTYYNFIFSELLFKIAALKYYYEKYFLPVHLSIHNASLHHKVYANDIKMLNQSDVTITEPIVKMGLWKDPLVQFSKDNEVWLTEQVHIVDELYNEWNLKNIKEATENNDYYYIHDTCGNIPIKFINYENEPQLHVHVILEKITSETDNVLYVNVPVNLLTDKIKLIDLNKREVDLTETFISYSHDNGKTYSPFFFGIESLKNILNTYDKKEINVNIDENGHYIIINDKKIYLTNEEQTLRYVDEYDNEYFVHVPNLDNANIDLFNNIGDCTVTYYRNVLLRLKISNDRINSFIIISNDVENDITDEITIMYSPTSEIFYESDFIFNPEEADRYLSFVLYPKMFNNVSTDIIYNRHGSNLTNNKIDITYFVNNRFRLRLLVNNRWHQYEFIVRIPDIQIEFGKLIYKYYDDELKFSTNFNQLSDLTETSLTFNSFMHEPRLTRMNHINFMEDFLKYLKISNARYIDGNIIPTNEFYYYIDVNFTDDGEEYSQRIYITDYDFGNDLIIPRKYFNYDMIFYLFLDKDMLYIFGETEQNNIYDVLGIDNGVMLFEDSDTGELYIDSNNYKKFVYNSDINAYEVETSEGIITFKVNESLRSDFNTFASKYIETHHITNDYKYLNQIHVYDLYRLNEHCGNNLITLNNNIDLRYHGIRFTHKSFLSENTIYLDGNTSNLITNSSQRETNNKSFLSGLKPSDEATSYAKYASYVNTYDDLVIYSAYEGDWLRPLGSNQDDMIIEPTGYVYYEKINIDGMPTGEYTTNNINVVEYSEQAYFDSTCSIEYKDFDNLQAFSEWLNNGNHIYISDASNINQYIVKKENNSSNNLYIDREIVNRSTSDIYYTAEIVKEHIISHEKTIINPTYNEFYNIIRTDVLDNNENVDAEYNYLVRIRMFANNNKILNNIQRIYEGNAECDENGVYSIIMNNIRIILTPFYTEYDGNHDVLFNVMSLVQQPGIDWIDINDIDDTINEISNDSDHIELSEINDINDNDIKTLLEHRKILILNISSKIINAIKNYEETLIFDDYILNIEDNENKTIKLKFKIDSKVLEDNEYVDVKTVMRCRYKINDEYHYDYFDDYAVFDAEIIEQNGSYIINSSDTYNEYYLSTLSINEEDETINKIYDDFVVFFALVPKTIDDYDFNITFNPRISLVYDDYDLLEYPSDSFDYSINYEREDFIKYKVNDTIYKYGDCHDIPSVVDLYNEFFDKKTTVFNTEYQFTIIDCNDQLNINKNLVEYDMYLMHNESSWYILYISKDTCNKSMALYDYEPLKKEIIFNTDEHQYKLIHNSSVKKFLINRYVYSSAEGKNHFNTDDIIVGKVLNNERLPIDIFKTSKWEMTPMSIGVDKKATTAVSNIDMCIFDSPMYNNEYVRGYYNVTYRYSLDRISTHQYKKYGTIRIG